MRGPGPRLDANITTLLAMVLLFMFGAGAIRGFAIAMSLGILISMFTAVVLMRMMMEALVRRRNPAQLAIAPLIGGVPAPGAFSFMRRGRLALAVSAALSLGAVGALVVPGSNLGIDFTGASRWCCARMCRCRWQNCARRLPPVCGPRLIWLTNRRGEQVIGLFALALAVVLFLPIPFGNTVPALAIAILALAVLERDGVGAIAGTALS